LNLLARSGDETSFWHIWSPGEADMSSNTPIRIPSDATVHEAVHIGVTPLNHSHMIGLKSSAHDTPELWVISHSPYDDPAENYEQIRLTWIGNDTRRDNRPCIETRDVMTVNEMNGTIRSKVYYPQSSPLEDLPLLVLIEGEGWRDEWRVDLKPAALAAENVAVMTVNPTGSLGYGSCECQCL
jgi:dipeptidyl aminopeptidase/acylaminoacyl peptidase